MKTKREGLCTECLKWPCESLEVITEREEVTFCKDVLISGTKIELMANGNKNSKTILKAGKKYPIDGIKEKKVLEGYYIRVKGERVLVPKQFAHLEAVRNKKRNTYSKHQES